MTARLYRHDRIVFYQPKNCWLQARRTVFEEEALETAKANVNRYGEQVREQLGLYNPISAIWEDAVAVLVQPDMLRNLKQAKATFDGPPGNQSFVNSASSCRQQCTLWACVFITFTDSCHSQEVCPFSGVIVNKEESRMRDHKNGRNYR